jgi:ribosomal protein L11 methylase PrmA
MPEDHLRRGNFVTEPIAGSFRDPTGSVFRRDGRIFRTVARRGVDDFEQVRATGLLDKLAADGLLVAWQEIERPGWLADDQGVIAKVLEHEPLAFLSHPYEWSFAGLKAAALFHLDIHLQALARDVTLSDATAYNIQFRGPKPVFIDHLSFRPYRDGEFWAGHRQFCEQFLNPLVLRARLGIPHHGWLRGAMEGLPSQHLAAVLPWTARLSPSLLMHVFLNARLERAALRKGNLEVKRAVSKRQLPRAAFERLLIGLRHFIESLEPKDTEASTWSNYADANSYADQEARQKAAFVARFAARTKPRMLWDIGCNTGEYSKVALSHGAHSAIGFEYDPRTLERAFRRAVDDALPFLPLHQDVANPSPDQGWRQRERSGLAGRRSADAILALAVVHHLAIGRNIPLPQVVDWLVETAPDGVIEFVRRDDPMVRQMLALREDIFEGYSDAAFDAALSARARIVESETLEVSGRRLVAYARR